MTARPSISRIAQLAATIVASVAEFESALAAKDIPSPAFDENNTTTTPEDAVDAQDTIIDAASELIDLLRAPLASLYLQGAHNANVPLQFISRFRIADLVPLGGRASYAEIAEKTGVERQLVRRLLRYAMTMRVFCEPEPDMVAHTRISKALANSDIPLNEWLRVGTHEMWPASVKMLDAVQNYPSASEPNETGFSLANNTSDSIYDILGQSPKRAAAFARSMKVFSAQPAHSTQYITHHYPWAALGPDIRVVDLGGSRGHVAIALASHHPNLRILVQDLPAMISGAEAALPHNLKGRVTFREHDLFSEQTEPADVYYMRWILHNWSDKYCLQILRAQIPMLRKGTRVIIQEAVLPEPGQGSLWRERYHRMSDMTMASVFNGKERTVAEWKALLAEADKRFVLKGVTEPKGSALGILEVIWEA
ncbi:S-adenosyl-L-methionine-dependent methyltransferase [Podospora aff. communis PSN243]|uniref:S-adenosyl-L-methionine-dependent methyltransferase n=1 Tax=Podospora aff. communis PSN243 TaxID=3040156 RepID=A0AAV9H3J4_9PEZI|nr:S-adenosyl-L-methionine-dependent methyltransferase [Podospora aff. communis PSN243]